MIDRLIRIAINPWFLVCLAAWVFTVGGLIWAAMREAGK